jgi:hypothetical protein
MTTGIAWPYAHVSAPQRVARVLDHLEAVTLCGDGWSARCSLPEHGDTKPSLTVSI